jgi:hypothetical protein
MARYLTSKTLLDSAKVRCMLPATQVTFTDEDLLRFANDEMDTAVVPYVMSFHEDYFLFQSDIPLETAIANYQIPYRAAGNKLRDVFFKDERLQLYEMTRILVEDLPFFQGDGTGSSNSPLRAFTLQNNEIVLASTSSSFNVTGWLNTYYYIRPSQLVDTSRSMTITAINRTTGVVTVSSVPANFSIGSTIDFIQTKSPHRCHSIDKVITNIDSVTTEITFAVADIPRALVVGDYICLAEECIIPQIPTDLHPMLAQRIACRCLEALGDVQGLQTANAKLVEMETKMGTVVDDRVEGAPMKVTNRHSFLRNSRRSFRR